VFEEIFAATDPTLPVVGGAAGTAVLLVVYLLRELNRSSGGAWKVVMDKNRTIHRMTWEKDRLAYQLAMCQGVEPPPNPGPYIPPTEEELRTW
jgi:hypothetical protein